MDPHSKPAQLSSGAVYVDARCCTNCGVPVHVAPEVFAWGREVCYVKRQPSGATELRKVLRVFRQQEGECIRYAGRDPRIISLLERVGEGGACDRDGPPRAGLQEQGLRVQA
jgi:hypothetical protein